MRMPGPLKNFVNKLHELIGPAHRIVKQLEVVNDNLPKINLPEVLAKFRESISAITEELADERPHLAIAKQGWFCDLKMPFLLPVEIQALIETQKFDEIDSILLKTYKKNFNRILEQLKVNFPSRREIAVELHQAHANQLYSLAIPSIIILADSICLDSIGIKFFNKDKDVDYQLKINAYLSGNQHPLVNVLTFSLKQNAPIYSHQLKLDDFTSNSLNRHQILHGEACGYGSEINFFKCVSLISLLMDLVERIPNRNDQIAN